MAQETIERTFPVPSPAMLELANIRGSVVIKAGEDGRIAVKAVKHAATGDSHATQVEMFQADDKRVVIRTRFEQSLLSLFRQACKVDYLVRVPAASSLDVSGVTNSAFIEGIEGFVKLYSVSGPLILSDIDGKIEIHTVSGPVSAHDLVGQVHLKTISGKVNIAGSSLSKTTASTVSAEVQVESSLSAGSYTFESVSGDIRLSLPESAACETYFNSLSGRQRFWPVSRDHKSTREKVVIHHHSISGNLMISQGRIQGTPSGETTLAMT